MLRFLLWRLLGLLALLVGLSLVAWCLGGGPGRALRGRSASGAHGGVLGVLSGAAREAEGWKSLAAVAPLRALAVALLALTAVIVLARWALRRRRALRASAPRGAPPVR